MALSVAVLVFGFVLGVSLAAPPGPILALSAQRTVRNGYWPGMVVCLGATTGDATHATLMGLGVFPLLAQFPRALAVANAGGAVLLLVLAWFAFQTGRRHALEPVDRPKGAPRSIILGGFVSGYLLALTSPYNFAWWLGVGTALFRDFGWPVFVGFFAGILAYAFFWVSLTEWARRRTDRVIMWVSYGSAAMLTGFALFVLWGTVPRLL